MKQYREKRLVAAVIGVLVALVVIVAIGAGSMDNRADRNVPGATTGAGKSSLSE